MTTTIYYSIGGRSVGTDSVNRNLTQQEVDRYVREFRACYPGASFMIKRTR